LDISLNLYVTEVQYDSPPYLSCDGVFSAVAPHISRFQSLHLNFIDAKGFVGSSNVFKRLEGASFPMLESITELHDDWNSIDRRMGYSSSWSTPVLHTLVLRDCLPHSLSSLANISTFDTKLLIGDDLISLLSMLLEMKSLSDLRIDVFGIIVRPLANHRRDLLALENIVLRSVRKLTVCHAYSHAADDSSDEFRFLQIVLSKLYFPTATHLIFKGFGTDRSQRTVLRHRLLRRISDQDRFPKAVSCDIFVNGGASIFEHTKLPTCFPANLENLTFACNTSLSFSEEDYPDVEPTLSRLRTLTLALNPDPHHDTTATMRWVLWLVDCLQTNGCWDTFQKLRLFRRVWRDGKDAFEDETIIPRDKIVAWCKSYHKFPGFVRR